MLHKYAECRIQNNALTKKSAFDSLRIQLMENPFTKLGSSRFSETMITNNAGLAVANEHLDMFLTARYCE